MITIYGIPNCDTVKKARTWLDQHQVPYAFHDFKKLGVSRQQLESWSASVGWTTLLNRKGTTWRKLTPERQAAIQTESDALDLMEEQASIIKRPVLELGGKILLGFDEKIYETSLLMENR